MEWLLVLFGVLGIFALLFGWMALLAVTNGYVLSVLWGWFIVPIFNLPMLSIVHAIGISMVVTFLTYHTYSKDFIEAKSKKDTKDKITTFLIPFLKPAMALLMGFIVKQFM